MCVFNRIKNVFRPKTKPFVEFVTTSDYVRETYPIEEARKSLPQAFSNIPNRDLRKDAKQTRTAKRCPGLFQYTTLGFIQRLWVDVVFESSTHDDKISVWYPTTTDQMKAWGIHQKPVGFMQADSFGNFMPFQTNPNVNNTVVKFQSPWHFRLHPDYALMVQPIFYDFNPNFTAVPGIIDQNYADILNVQCLWHPTEHTTFLPAGTPLFHIIPIRREHLDYTIRSTTKEDQKEQQKIQWEQKRFFNHVFKQRL
ncbi:MAG: hypothetical protein VW683_01390 [Betaproteobacteria bacterium]|jgi:hypothetical protein